MTWFSRATYVISTAVALFVLARDVQDFQQNYAEEVLALVDELGFSDQFTAPVPIGQEDCVAF